MSDIHKLIVVLWVLRACAFGLMVAGITLPLTLWMRDRREKL